MGEITEMMLEGILCQECGVYMDDDDDFPHSCEDCKEAQNDP